MVFAKENELQEAVRKKYGQVASSDTAGCGCGPTCCSASTDSAESLSENIGYSKDEMNAVPKGANMGLGCGNPQAIAALKPGEHVLDLGSGGGFDAFLAAAQIGEGGRVIGVDMTPEMISKARNNAEKGSHRNVAFRLGEIENLPVADNTIDVIISNCVINLSPNKHRVFQEAYRVLKPGGRVAISDIVSFAPIPESLRQDMSLYTGCMVGASLIGELEDFLRQSGFEAIKITPKDESKSFIDDWAPGKNITDYVVSATIEAQKPID